MQTRYLPICAVFVLALSFAVPVKAQQDVGNGQYPGANMGGMQSQQYPAYGNAPPQPYGGGQMQGLPQAQMQQQYNPQFGAMPNAAGAQLQSSPGMKKPSAQQSAQVFHWFIQYDEVRRRAQMNPIERQQADGLLARGFSLFMPGQDKMAAKQLLTNLVNKYHGATQAMKALPVVPETKQLQIAYYQYFENAMNLFADYLRVQDNIFAVDSTGQAIAKQLLQRKVALEALEHNCKNLDLQMRQHYGVAAYQF